MLVSPKRKVIRTRWAAPCWYKTMVGYPSLEKKQGGTSHIAIEEVGHPLSKGVGCPKTGGLAQVDNRNVWAHPH